MLFVSGKTDKSAIAQHVHDQEQPHEINWETCLCSTEPKLYGRES